MSDPDSGSLEDQLAWVIRMPGFIKSLTKKWGLMRVSICRISWRFSSLVVMMCLGVNYDVIADQSANSQESGSVTDPPYNA